MVQLWNMPPSGTSKAGTTIKTSIPNALESLRTLFSGSSAPSATAAYMLWADTANGLLKMRNAGDSDWVIVGPLGTMARDEIRVGFGSLSATASRRVLAPKGGFLVERLVLISDTLSSSSSGNEWQYALRNVTAAGDLFSGTVGTFTALGGVGGGTELAVDVGNILIPDQNASLAVNDVLRFTMTKVGTATTLTDFCAVVEGYPLG